MIVLDANAALEISLEGERGNAIKDLMLQGEESIAPALFHSEIANACFKYVTFGPLAEEESQLLFERTEALIDRFHDDESLAKEALSEAIHYHHPAYDMFYLVLARRTGAMLFTLDRKMWALAREMGVNCIEEASLED